MLQEFYADFVAVDPCHFSLNISSNHLYMLPVAMDPSKLQQYCDRIVDGISAVFLALKRRPIIRYQRASDIAKRIAQDTAVSRHTEDKMICILLSCTCSCKVLNLNIFQEMGEFSPIG